MPSSITHTYFGIDVYNKLPTKYKKNINLDYLKIFSQGSDPFMFYNFFIGKTAKEINYIQEIIHTKKTNIFFKNNIKYIINNNLTNNPEIITYLYGYICHYYLDLYTHPYIYYKSGLFDKKNSSTYKYNAIHQKYEYLIDLYFISKREKIPYYKFKPHKFLFPTKEISNTLENLINNTLYETYKYENLAKYYKKSLNHMYLFYKHINYDPYLYKLLAYSLIDKITKKNTIKLKELSFHNKLDNINSILNINNETWYLPWDKTKEYTTSFIDLYKRAIDDTVNTITALSEMFYKNKIDYKLIDNLFPNISLVTGLSCNTNVIMKYFEF